MGVGSRSYRKIFLFGPMSSGSVPEDHLAGLLSWRVDLPVSGGCFLFFLTLRSHFSIFQIYILMMGVWKFWSQFLG